MLSNSPISPFYFRGNFYHIKRDDLLDRDFNGNKARKFLYFLEHDFEGVDTLISFGSAQSNAMYSMSVLAKKKGWRFVYYSCCVSKYLKKNPQGNYLYALKNGMELIEVDLRGEELREYVLSLDADNVLIIEEGGRVKEAEYGIKKLADELKYYVNKNCLKIFLPSGTGTTAFFLAKNINSDVITTPCIGDEKYLIKQMSLLGEIPSNLKILSFKKYHFGKLYKELFDIWIELKNSGIEFDLLYDTIGWRVILEYNLESILYIHQGGLIGNETMLNRYFRKYGSF